MELVPRVCLSVSLLVSLFLLLTLSCFHTRAHTPTNTDRQNSHTRWGCGSLGAVSQWRWAASEHILSPAQDSIWWLMRCNWSVDYYLSCACQIKIIKMQGERKIEWNVSGLLHCGRVVMPFYCWRQRNLTILLRRTLCHLQNWTPPLFPTPSSTALWMSVWQARTCSPHTEWGGSLGVESVGRHGRHWKLTDSCDSTEMSEMGFTGVKPELTVQGHQNAWQLPDTWWPWMVIFRFGNASTIERVRTILGSRLNWNIEGINQRKSKGRQRDWKVRH